MTFMNQFVIQEASDWANHFTFSKNAVVTTTFRRQEKAQPNIRLINWKIYYVTYNFMDLQK